MYLPSKTNIGNWDRFENKIYDPPKPVYTSKIHPWWMGPEWVQVKPKPIAIHNWHHQNQPHHTRELEQHIINCASQMFSTNPNPLESVQENMKQKRFREECNPIDYFMILNPAFGISELQTCSWNNSLNMSTERDRNQFVGDQDGC